MNVETLMEQGTAVKQDLEGRIANAQRTASAEITDLRNRGLEIVSNLEGQITELRSAGLAEVAKLTEQGGRLAAELMDNSDSIEQRLHDLEVSSMKSELLHAYRAATLADRTLDLAKVAEDAGIAPPEDHTTEERDMFGVALEQIFNRTVANGDPDAIEAVIQMVENTFERDGLADVGDLRAQFNGCDFNGCDSGQCCEEQAPTQPGFWD